jgi:uncharacterized repeat protein (TIGR01451 family)
MSASGNNNATTTKISDFIVEKVTVFGLTSCGVYPIYADNAAIRDSVIRDNGSDLVDLCDNIQLRRGSSNALIENNLILRAGHYGIDIPLTNNDTATGQSSNNNIIRGNIIAGNGVNNNGGQLSGIGVRTSVGTLIEKNQIYGNRGDGIVVTGVTIPTSNKITISQNSIYSNGELGIDLGAGAAGDGVSANDGAINAAQPNNGLDYPIITSSNLSSGTLTVSGYVGNNSAGSATFANLTLEFFIAADDGNNNGAVIVGDGLSKPHGEGKTYIGTCNTDANGKFNCSFANAGVLGLTDVNNLTATATDAVGNTSEFSAAMSVPVPVASNPNVLLVKRITAMNGLPSKSDGTPLNTYQNDVAYPYDDNNNAAPTAAFPQKSTDKWPGTILDTSSTFLLGAIAGGNVRPNDELDYTIYFLSAGDADAKNVSICDLVPENQTFVTNAYGSSPTGLDRGMMLSTNGQTTYLTNFADSDIGRYYSPSDPNTPTICKKFDSSGVVTAFGPAANTRGAIVVNLGTLTKPDPLPAGSPASGHGFIRFRARVD